MERTGRLTKHPRDEPDAASGGPEHRRRHPARGLGRPLRAVAVVTLLLGSGLVYLLAATPARAGAPGNPGERLGSSPSSAESLRVRSAPEAPLVAPGPRYGSAAFCLAALAPGCPGFDVGVPSVPHPAASGPTSWKNLTPNPVPASYPIGRAGATMTFDPYDSETLLFGGSPNGAAYPNDTWSYINGNWTDLVSASTCGATSCPVGRVDAGFTWDATDNEAVLFGGLTVTTSGFQLLDDTWVFAGGHWKNITASAGSGPGPRDQPSMSFVSEEGYVLFFGGLRFNTTTTTYLGDTWSFVHGTWTNISATEKLYPSPRAGAALADSPIGTAMMFGGVGALGLVENSPSCGTNVQYWFSGGQWTDARITGCVTSPEGRAVPFTSSNTTGNPCGRTGAALAWSPRNHHFMLFGGDGFAGTGCPTSGTATALNDTYLYTAAPGGIYAAWQPDPSPGAPSDREFMAYAPDYRDGYVVIFGGEIDRQFVTNESWRYYAVVSTHFAGPRLITQGLGFPIFTLIGFGGSGDLGSIFNTTGLKTANLLTGSPGCANFTDGSGRPVPPDGTDVITCQPAPGAFNVYRLSVTVWDVQHPTQRAFANWTFTSDPPEALILHTQYAGYFYTGISFTNTYTIFAEIDNAPVSAIAAQLGPSYPLTLSHGNSSMYWWQASVNMGNVSPTANLSVIASTSNWSENATLPIEIATTPDLLRDVGYVPGATQGIPVTGGTGPFNRSYSISQTVQVSLSQFFSFNLPSSVPLLSGVISLLPTVQVQATETSSGNVSITASFAITPPSIDLVGGTLNFTATLTLTGNLVVASSHGVTSVNWVSGLITFGIRGDFNGSIPIYGYTFDLFGQPVTIGIALTIGVSPTLEAKLVLAPAPNSSTALANGLAFIVTQVLGEFDLPIYVAINVGIGIASVSIGGTASFDAAFTVTPSFECYGFWLNGSAFITVQFLWWSATWTFYPTSTLPGQNGVWYYANPSAPGLRPVGAAGFVPSPYANGTNATWSVDGRSYNISGYDRLAWTGANSSGVAVANVYPHTEASAASGYGGSTIFYTDDDVARPVSEGLRVAGLALDPSTNRLTPVPAPSDPGYVISAPRAATLSDGSEFVVWNALPVGQAKGSTPLGVSEIALHGARYHPGNGTWGPVVAYTSSGVVQSFGLDARGVSPEVVGLVTPGLLPVNGGAEWLRTFNLTTGAGLANVSVKGYGSVVSVRAAGGASVGTAVLNDLEGNASLVQLSDGTVEALAYVPSPSSHLVGESQVSGAASTLLLRYHRYSAEYLVLYDTSKGTALATEPVPGDVTDAQATFAGGLYYVYALNGSGALGWAIAPDGVATAEPWTPVPGAVNFGLTQLGGSILLYAIARGPSGNTSRSLWLAELAGGLPPLTAGGPTAGASTSAPAAAGPFDWYLYLGVPIVAAAAVLVLLGLRRRRSGPGAVAPGPTPPAPSADAPAGGGPPPPGAVS